MVTCIVCQSVSIVATEYTYRKLELKENRTRISELNYKLLCTVRLGIFRSFIIFIRENWNRSKYVFLSVVCKAFSLIAGAGLLVLGLTIVSHEFIINVGLKLLFYRLEFYNYYLYDILVGVCATCIVIGILTIVLAICGIVGSWRHSSKIMVVTSLSSFALTISRVACIVIWSVFLYKINDTLRSQLEIQQKGYYVNSNANDLTHEWNIMIQKLDCCGVNYYSDTWTSVKSTIFCYENAKEISTYPSETYSSYINLDSVNGRGNVRTTTCTWKIKFVLRMMIGWFIAITLLQIILEAIGYFLVNSEFKIYKKEDSLMTKKDEMSSEEQNGETLATEILNSTKELTLRLWQRSRIRFWGLLLVTLYVLFNFGLLVIAINIRYDKVLGNTYINDYILSSISTSSYTLSSVLEKFHIVVTTFSLASLGIGIYVIVLKVLRFGKKIFLLYLAAGFFTISLVVHIVFVGLWAKVYMEISNGALHQMATIIRYYSQADSFLLSYNDFTSAAWNTLFLKAECCGVGNEIQSSFIISSWYSSYRTASQVIPVYCCKDIGNLYPYNAISATQCTDLMQNGTYHNQGCDKALENKFDAYSIPFFILLAFSITLEFAIIFVTVKETQNVKRKPQIPVTLEDENEKAVKVVEDISEIMQKENEMAKPRTESIYETEKMKTEIETSKEEFNESKQRKTSLKAKRKRSKRLDRSISRNSNKSALDSDENSISITETNDRVVTTDIHDNNEDTRRPVARRNSIDRSKNQRNIESARTKSDEDMNVKEIGKVINKNLKDDELVTDSGNKKLQNQKIKGRESIDGELANDLDLKEDNRPLNSREVQERVLSDANMTEPLIEIESAMEKDKEDLTAKEVQRSVSLDGGNLVLEENIKYPTTDGNADLHGSETTCFKSLSREDLDNYDNIKDSNEHYS